MARALPALDLPNLQIALDHYMEAHQASYRTVGYDAVMAQLRGDLRSLLGERNPQRAATVGGLHYRQVDVGIDERVSCLENGIYLIESPAGKLAAHVRSNALRGGLELEVMATTTEAAAHLISQVQHRIESSSVYRGKILSLDGDSKLPGRVGFSHFRFHRFPRVCREDIILPDATLELLERNTVRFFQHADTLRRSGRPLKRGLLLHGNPGTGKTFVAKWLAQSLPGITTLLLSSDQLELVKECCQIARMLAPALFILEDVDLIASERNEHRAPVYQVTLHQLMNEMDGLSSNSEVLFLLTTNRPDVIERAIASRPGRVDQAIEFPLPDAQCRWRLLELYGRGLVLVLSRPEEIITRTKGASPAFIQELIRKAAMLAAERGSEQDGTLHLSDMDFDTALREMVLGNGKLTRNLLGFAPSEADDTS